MTNRGEPIEPALLAVIFEPFRRGVPGDRSPHGLGLGLYIVQQIVLAHGGDIGVESTAPAGTAFTIRVPRTPCKKLRRRSGRHPDEPQSVHGLVQPRGFDEGFDSSSRAVRK